MNRQKKPLEVDIRLSNNAARLLVFAGVVVIVRRFTKGTKIDHKYTRPVNKS